MSDEIKEKQFDILNRREVLKGLATVPVLGFFFVKFWKKMRLDKLKKSNLLQDLVKQKKPLLWFQVSEIMIISVSALLAMVVAEATSQEGLVSQPLIGQKMLQKEHKTIS